MKKTTNGGVFFLLFTLLFFTQYIYAKKTIYAGVYDNPPLSFINDNNKADGLFPSILNEIAKKNDFDIVYKPCKWDECLKMLSNKTIDILSPVAKTNSREKHYLFADENILTNFGNIYTQKNKPIAFWTDLIGKRVGLLRDDIHANYFLDYLKNFKLDVSIHYFDSYKKMFKLLSNDKLDAIVSNSIIFINYQKIFPGIKKSSIILDQIPITFAFNKDDKELKKSIDKTLKGYKIDINSIYYKLLKKYLNVKTDNHYLRYILFILVVLVFLLLLLFIINQILHNLIKKATKTINEKYQKELYLNRIINTVKNVNQVLLLNIKLQDKLSLVCKKITEEKLYSISHIGIIKDKKIEIISSLDSIEKDCSIKLDDNDKQICYIKEAIKQDKTIIAKVPDTQYLLKEKIDNKNLTYLMATPIKLQDKKIALGSIIVYTTKKDGFCDKEISLIEELSGDISLCINLELLKEKNSKYLIERVKNYKEMVFSLNKTIEARDPYTAGHNSRVSKYATLIAKKMGLSHKDIKVLQYAGELHDIGKIETPDSILLKPGPLNSYEYDIIKMHPQKGYEIVSNITFLKNVAQIVLYHHERYDGSGYPYGLKKDEIPLLSQILSIADTFDAMTTNRIYKPAKSKDSALKEIDSLSDTWFDRTLVKYTLEALKNIDIQANNTIEQQAKDPLTDARFAYFFKDHLTECYNHDYLMHMFIIKDIDNYSYIYTIAIYNFTNYNKIHSWEEGDRVLKSIAKTLQECSANSKVFRIKGDDFMVISKEYIELNSVLQEIFTKHYTLTYKIKQYQIKDINSIETLKNIVRDL